MKKPPDPIEKRKMRAQTAQRILEIRSSNSSSSTKPSRCNTADSQR
jgi:hypothetical protein